MDSPFKFFEPKPENTIRIIPYPRLAVETAIHRLAHEAIYCPAHTGPNPKFNYCPICDAYQSMLTVTKNGRHPELQKKLKNIRPVKRYFLNIVEKGSSEIKVMSVGRSVYEQIIAVAYKKPKLSVWRRFWNWLKSWVYPVERPSIFDLEEYGHDFLFTVKQKTISPTQSYPEYTIRPAPKPTPAGTRKQIEEWKETAPDLIQAIPLIPQQQVLKKLTETEPEVCDIE